MKTRDIKTADSAHSTEETEEAAKTTAQPLSSSQPTRQRAPRASKVAATTPDVTDSSTACARARNFESVMILLQERRDIQHAQQQQRDDNNRQASSSYYSEQYSRIYIMHSMKDLSIPSDHLEDLSLAELSSICSSLWYYGCSDY